MIRLVNTTKKIEPETRDIKGLTDDDLRWLIDAIQYYAQHLEEENKKSKTKPKIYERRHRRLLHIGMQLIGASYGDPFYTPIQLSPEDVSK